MIRLIAVVVPNSSPVIAATRSNSATATSPQLSPPTISSPSVVKSSAFTLFLPSLSYFCPGNVQSRPVSVKSLYKFRTMGLVSSDPQLRIGELSRRTGVGPPLRAGPGQGAARPRPPRAVGAAPPPRPGPAGGSWGIGRGLRRGAWAGAGGSRLAVSAGDTPER